MDKRLFSLILTAVLLLSLLAACGESSENTDPPASPEGVSEPAAVEAPADAEEEEEDPTAALYADLPSGDYNGKAFTILNPRHTEYDFIGDIEGDVISEAVYKRNQTVETDLNISFTPVMEPGLWDDKDSFSGKVRNSVMAADDAYQLISGYGAYITSLASDGVFANWNNVQGINFEKPWWNSDIVYEMNVADHLFFITGDMTMTSVEYLFCLFFNKVILTENSLDSPYDLVREGKWTLEKMKEYAQVVSVDLDGNGRMTIKDMYGYSTDSTNMVSGYMAAFDAAVTVKGDDGLPTLAISDEGFVNRFLDLYDFLFKSNNCVFLSTNEGSYVGDNRESAKIFSEGRALFVAEILGNSASMRDVDFDFGILPYPKYTEDQAEYHTTAWDAYNLFCIPRTADLDFTGVVTENMAARSFEEVLPAFYDKALRSKYARDEDSAEMISIIRAGATYNFGVVNSPHIERPGHIWRDLISDRSSNIASKTGKNAKAMEKALETFLTNTYINAD